MIHRPRPEQIDFIRRHGITRCPPGPTFRMSWGARPKARGFGELTEADQFAQMMEGGTGLTLAEGFRAAKLRREARGEAAE